MKNRKKWTKTSIIEFFKKVHNNKYDYSLVNYTKLHDFIEIICLKHGIFKIEANHHKNGVGCAKCAFEKNKDVNRGNLEIFTNKANLKHNFKYDYNKSKYINAHTKICIICPIHGEFWQTPNGHLSNSGCNNCGIDKKLKSLELFLQQCDKIHGNKYDYSLVDYKSNSKRIKIICKEHGIFEQTPDSHINGKSGCPLCGKIFRGFNKSNFVKKCKELKGIFYILKMTLNKEVFLKIGITSKSISKRYSHKKQLKYQYIILKEVVNKPNLIWDLEKHILKKFKNCKYKPESSFSGDSECLEICCLEQILKEIDNYTECH